jgi:phosphatidylglycerol:prolipoprotein diacylglycerol transferase
MHLYGLILGISLLIGFNYFLRYNTIVPKPKENIFIFGLIIFSLLGARLYHVIDYWPYYSTDLPQILHTWNGGLGIFGGLIFGLVFILIFAKIYHLSSIKILNTSITIIPLCQSIGRLANFFNHEIPTWWLESLGCFFIFLILIKFPKHPTAKYLIAYGLLRFFLEFLRPDTWQISEFKIAQIITLLFVLSGLILLRYQPSANRSSPPQ